MIKKSRIYSLNRNYPTNGEYIPMDAGILGVIAVSINVLISIGVLHAFSKIISNAFRKKAIRLDERETSCQVVACFIPHSIICPDQPQ